MTGAENSVELIAAVYPNTFEAKARMNDLTRMGNDGDIELIDGAVMVRQYSGNLEITDRAALTPTAGAQRGALIGTVIGVVFPPSLLASAAIGAAAGAIAGGRADHPLASELLDDLAEHLEPGRSAVLAVIDPRWNDAVVATLEGYDEIVIERLDAAHLESSAE